MSCPIRKNHLRSIRAVLYILLQSQRQLLRHIKTPPHCIKTLKFLFRTLPAGKLGEVRDFPIQILKNLLSGHQIGRILAFYLYFNQCNRRYLPPKKRHPRQQQHHRKRNQHRIFPFFKHFSPSRKQLYTPLAHILTTPATPHRL